jgi:hypothetical protein
LGHGVSVGGGTAWLWSRPDACASEARIPTVSAISGHRDAVTEARLLRLATRVAIVSIALSAPGSPASS